MVEIVRKPFLKIHPDDNVLVALQDLTSGTAIKIDQQEIILPQNVAAKHKFFINNMHAGDEVIMYGSLVGKIQTDLPKGSLMTTANTHHAAGEYGWRNKKATWQKPDVSKF